MEHTNILPQIKPLEFITQENSYLVYDKLMSNLIICYVEATNTENRFLSEERIKELHIDRSELKKIAIENLRNLPNNKDCINIMDHPNGTHSISYESLDSYDATRLLLLFKTNLDFFIETIGDPFIVAIPCRDFLLAAPVSFENKLASYAQELYETKPFPITKELFMFSKKDETFTQQ